MLFLKKSMESKAAICNNVILSISINRKRPPSPACGESGLAVLGYKVSPLVAMTCLYQLKDFFL